MWCRLHGQRTAAGLTLWVWWGSAYPITTGSDGVTRTICGLTLPSPQAIPVGHARALVVRLLGDWACSLLDVCDAGIEGMVVRCASVQNADDETVSTALGQFPILDVSTCRGLARALGCRWQHCSPSALCVV